jgi:diaminohydroxyphosphoribosylaminopyrimidine deaminase/5-amino-6-(5-phosphoribosylamino)uracil reductase
MSDFMQRALTLAREGIALASPNPMVGCVVVSDGEIAGFGTHTWEGLKHAEILALYRAGDRARGATVYVTLEPCAHTGRTGPCCDALIAAGVARVVYASHDPNPHVAGEGLRRLRSAGIQVAHAAEFEAEAVKLNEPFFHFLRTRKPLVTLKCAMTLDGKISAPEDNTGWITSERARHHVQGLRHAADAIVTGIGTVLADDPLLTDRSGLPRTRPLLRVVLDSTLRLSLDSKMAQSANGDLLVVSTSAGSPERRLALEKRGIEVKSFDGPRGRVDIRDVVSMLGERRCLSAVIEAGSKLNWAVLEAGAADKVFLYYAPKILGGTASLPMAGGAGRQRRVDAIQLERTVLHPIPPDEFAVEAFIRKES